MYTTPDIPVLLSGIVALMGSVNVYFMPELFNVPLPDTIEDVENYREIKKEIELENKLEASKHNMLPEEEDLVM